MSSGQVKIPAQVSVKCSLLFFLKSWELCVRLSSGGKQLVCGIFFSVIYKYFSIVDFDHGTIL